MAIQYVLDEIRRLGAEDGLNDGEIADIIGCSRATVNRNRNKFNIPKANLRNRKDKHYVCLGCHKTITIMRKEFARCYCQECENKILAEYPDFKFSTGVSPDQVLDEIVTTNSLV